MCIKNGNLNLHTKPFFYAAHEQITYIGTDERIKAHGIKVFWLREKLCNLRESGNSLLEMRNGLVLLKGPIS